MRCNNGQVAGVFWRLHQVFQTDSIFTGIYEYISCRVAINGLNFSLKHFLCNYVVQLTCAENLVGCSLKSSVDWKLTHVSLAKFGLEWEYCVNIVALNITKLLQWWRFMCNGSTNVHVLENVSTLFSWTVNLPPRKLILTSFAIGKYSAKRSERVRLWCPPCLCLLQLPQSLRRLVHVTS